MSSESINQTPHELKTAVDELSRNISRLEVAQAISTVLQLSLYNFLIKYYSQSYIVTFPKKTV